MYCCMYIPCLRASCGGCTCRSEGVLASSLRVHFSGGVCVRESVGVRADTCVRVSACACESEAGELTSDGASEETSGFRRRQSLSLCWSSLEEEGSWDVEDAAGRGREEEESAAGLGEVREDVGGTEADGDTTGDGEEVEDGLRAQGVRAEGDNGEEDLEAVDFGAEEEEVVLEDAVLRSE